MNRCLYSIAITILFSFLSACDLGPSTRYKLDNDNLGHVSFKQFTNGISEVRLYVSSLRRGLDPYKTLAKTLAMNPTFATKDQSQISQVLEALGDYNPKIDNPHLGITAITYDILLFETGTNKVMQFRVFSPNIDTNSSAIVLTRSSSGFAYSSRKIVHWLRAVQNNTGGTNQ
jgi:hypothetical protein